MRSEGYERPGPGTFSRCCRRGWTGSSDRCWS